MMARKSSGDGDYSFVDEPAESLFGEGACGLEQEEASPSHAAESTSTTEDDCEESTSDSDIEMQECIKPAKPDAGFEILMVNSKSLVVHCLRHEGILKCGRKVSPVYKRAQELFGFRCSRCFNV